ncbi:hypothetical protein Hanom_Chr11g01012771 [Helianthus anomalus]
MMCKKIIPASYTHEAPHHSRVHSCNIIMPISPRCVPNIMPDAYNSDKREQNSCTQTKM